MTAVAFAAPELTAQQLARHEARQMRTWLQAQGRTPLQALDALGPVDLWPTWDAVEDRLTAISLQMMEHRT